MILTLTPHTTLPIPAVRPCCWLVRDGNRLRWCHRIAAPGSVKCLTPHKDIPWELPLCSN